MGQHRESTGVNHAWRALIEDRYGSGSGERLTALLQQPCVTYAEIAAQFGVTRECVRQWHQRLLPGAPRGHERRRLCRAHQRKRRLLQDRLFAGFYRRIRSHVPGQRMTLIPSREGFRRRTVRIDGHVVVLRRARPGPASRSGGGVVYTLPTGDVRADFIYYELSAAEYLFIPRHVLPQRATTFLDIPGSKYQSFKNTLTTLMPEGSRAAGVASDRTVSSRESGT